MEFINDTDNITDMMNTINYYDENNLQEPNNKSLNVNNYECNICYKTYNHKKSLASHMVKHQNLIYHCDLCDKVYYNNSSYKSHKTNHKNNIHKCNLCSKVYKFKASLNNHLVNHTNQYFKCKLCNKIYMNKRTLTTHFNKKHKIKDLGMDQL